MNRRSFVAGVLAWLAALVTGRLFRRHLLPDTTPDGFRRLAEPYWIEKGEPIGLLALEADPPAPTWRFPEGDVSWRLSWKGRIVRQACPLPGQRELCIHCSTVDCPSDETCPHYYAESALGRTPVHGSPERAYLEYMAKHHPHPESTWSDSNTLRRLDAGELAVSDVYIRLASAEEIDVPGGAYAGGRGEAFATYISVLE